MIAYAPGRNNIAVPISVINTQNLLVAGFDSLVIAGILAIVLAVLSNLTGTLSVYVKFVRTLCISSWKSLYLHRSQ